MFSTILIASSTLACVAPAPEARGQGLGRVIFGSDHPFLPLPRALDEARALPLSDQAMHAFLGGTARRLLVKER